MKVRAMLLAALLLLPACLSAQTKGETSLYAKTLKKPGLKSAAKFLKKYPESVYAPKVLRLRDSVVFFALDPEDAEGVKAFRKDYPESPFRELADERIARHNTSAIAKEDALKVAGDCLDAVGWKKDNVEHVLALDKDFTVRILSPAGEIQSSRSIPVHTLQAEVQTPSELALPLEVVAPLGTRRYLHFAYLNGGTEYVEVLYLPEEDIINQAMFYGTAMKPAADGGFRIEGQSPEDIEGLTLTGEVAWLLGRIRENPSLVQISKADLLTDNAIRWWMEKNPRAGKASGKIIFGSLDPESSIVAAFKKARKEKGKNCTAALFDIRGYTVICTQSRKDGGYSLAWCEPRCKNKYRDNFLNSIYFESDGVTLVMFYYRGRTTFKYRLSTASQMLRK